MGRILVAVLVAFLTTIPSARASYPDAAAAQEAVFNADGALPAEQREQALKLLKSEWERSPKDADNLYALVRVCADSNEWDTGLPAARALAKLGPEVADYQYMLGTALFSTINEVSMFNKGARASAGRKAYQKAIKIDPTHVGARTGLCHFYMEAPGFAGGSMKKAREIATTMSQEPENASQGYELLLKIAAKEKDWEEYNRLLPEMLDSASSEEDRINILFTATYSAIFTRKDYSEGLEFAARYREAAGEGRHGYTTNYFEGVAKHGLERYNEAVGKFEKVLAVEPNARNTRWLMAVSLEELGRDSEAATHYAEFAERFPDHDDAKKAKKKAKKLR